MKRMGKSRLFLLELLIDLLFFCICAAACMQLLLHANEKTARAGALSGAAEQAQNAAEAFKAADGDPARTARLLGANGTLTLRFDGDWRPTSENAAYVLKMDVERAENALCTAGIRVEPAAGGDALYTLTVRRFAGEVGA